MQQLHLRILSHKCAPSLASGENVTTRLQPGIFMRSHRSDPVLHRTCRVNPDGAIHIRPPSCKNDQ